MKKTAIIQARMGSTRLPGKVMKIIKGKTVLEHVVTRVKAAEHIDDIIIATTMNSKDDEIVDESTKLGVKYYRGDEEDVLSRYYFAAKENNSDVIIRITSDCPLIDPFIIDKMMEKFLNLCKKNSSVDYFSNTLERTYPRGLDVEIFTFTVLKRAFFEAHEFYQREHVTPYIYQSPDAFVICGSKRNKDLSRLRWTLDTYEDLKFINTIYEYLYKNDELFYTRDILELLDIHPEIIKINENVFQKELANPK